MENLNYQDEKLSFLIEWSKLGQTWGFSPAESTIHGYLLLQRVPLTTDDLIERLSFSRGKTSEALKVLTNFGLVERVKLFGERKKYFIAERNVFKIFKCIVTFRRDIAIRPMYKHLISLHHRLGQDEIPRDEQQFIKMTKEMQNFGAKTEKIIQVFLEAEESEFLKLFLKLV